MSLACPVFGVRMNECSIHTFILHSLMCFLQVDKNTFLEMWAVRRVVIRFEKPVGSLLFHVLKRSPVEYSSEYGSDDDEDEQHTEESVSEDDDHCMMYDSDEDSEYNPPASDSDGSAADCMDGVPFFVIDELRAKLFGEHSPMKMSKSTVRKYIEEITSAEDAMTTNCFSTVVSDSGIIRQLAEYGVVGLKANCVQLVSVSCLAKILMNRGQTSNAKRVTTADYSQPFAYEEDVPSANVLKPSSPSNGAEQRVEPIPLSTKKRNYTSTTYEDRQVLLFESRIRSPGVGGVDGRLPSTRQDNVRVQTHSSDDEDDDAEEKSRTLSVSAPSARHRQQQFDPRSKKAMNTSRSINEIDEEELDEDRSAILKKAFRDEVTRFEQQQQPDRVRIDLSRGSAQGAIDIGAISLKVNTLPRSLRMELDVFIETAQDEGVNLLRCGVFNTKVSDSTVDRYQKDIRKYAGFLHKVSKKRVSTVFVACSLVIFI